MRASYGITFSEKNHTDKGPEYEHKFKVEGHLKPRLSRGEYERIHKKRIMMQQIGENRVQKQNLDYDSAFNASDNPPEIVSEFEGINNSNYEEMPNTVITTDNYPTLVADGIHRREFGANETFMTSKSQVNRSQIRILSTKGRHDVISKPTKATAHFSHGNTQISRTVRSP